MGISETLKQLPDDYPVVLRARNGGIPLTDTAAGWLSAHNGQLDTNYELVSDLHLPDQTYRPDVDWTTFWDETTNDHDWLIEPIIPRGRNIALFAPAGEGKSELTLALACQAALEGISVLYLDFEMTTADLMDRLYDMGYGPKTDLANLHYQLHPDLPTLDTAEGGQALDELAAERNAQLIIIDTFMRIVAGPENDADTLLAYDLHTGRLMKRAGRTVLRIDHAGKDVTLGARGTSAKRDDVDLIWQLQRRDQGVRLKAQKRRMGWIPELVDLTRNDFPVTYGQVPATWPEGTKRLARLLDELEVDPELGRPSVRQILSEHGETAKNSLLSAAIKYRREYHYQLEFNPGPDMSQTEGTARGTVGQNPSSETGTVQGVYRHPAPVQKEDPDAEFDDFEPDLTDLPEPF